MKTVLAVAILAFLAISASATTVSFVPPAGGFPSGGGFLAGNATTVTIGGIAINGYTLSGGSNPSNLVAAPLFGRHETGDSGIGICSAGESCTVPGGGDSNELSNEHNQEVLRLTLPSGSTWLSVTLSSLDNNGGGAPERGLILTDGPNNTFSVICAFAGAGPAASGSLTSCTQSGGTGVEPVFSIPTTYAGSLHLYFAPFDWLNGTNTNNDFLVQAASISSTVPEPGSLALIGSGLIAIAGAVRRSKKS
jgi:hypothetical protein